MTPERVPTIEELRAMVRRVTLEELARELLSSTTSTWRLMRRTDLTREERIWIRDAIIRVHERRAAEVRTGVFTPPRRKTKPEIGISGSKISRQAAEVVGAVADRGI